MIFKILLGAYVRDPSASRWAALTPESPNLTTPIMAAAVRKALSSYDWAANHYSVGRAICRLQPPDHTPHDPAHDKREHKDGLKPASRRGSEETYIIGPKLEVCLWKTSME